MKCDLNSLRSLLEAYPQDCTNIYIAYIKQLHTQKKGKQLVNPWAKDYDTDWYYNQFIKVARDGIYIDGDCVTLTSLGITYDYNAYKKILLLKFPETKLDVSLVYDGDEFTFHKSNGNITYTHNIRNPFATGKKIIGAYAIVTNSRGAFLETIDIDDINKFKNSSKMSHIWKVWYDRMVLKSVLKRICKIGFYDVFQNVEQIDNEQSDPNNANVESTLQDKIRACTTREQLNKLWKREYINDRALYKLFKEKTEEIQQANQDKPQKKLIDDKQLKLAIGEILAGNLDKDEFLEHHQLTDMQQTYFEEAANV